MLACRGWKDAKRRGVAEALVVRKAAQDVSRCHSKESECYAAKTGNL